MYLWKINNLVSELRKESLTQENFKNYYLVSSVIVILSAYVMALYTPTNLTHNWADAIGTILVTIIGLNLAFKANGGNTGSHFLNKTISIYVPLTIRITVASTLVIIPLVVLELFFSVRISEEWFLSILTLSLNIIFFWRLFVHLKNTNIK